MSGQQIPAGWYNDGQGSVRWWDGVQWTPHVQSVATAVTGEFSPSSSIQTDIATPLGAAQVSNAQPGQVQPQKSSTWQRIIGRVLIITAGAVGGVLAKISFDRGGMIVAYLLIVMMVAELIIALFLFRYAKKATTAEQAVKRRRLFLRNLTISGIVVLWVMIISIII